MKAGVVSAPAPTPAPTARARNAERRARNLDIRARREDRRLDECAAARAELAAQLRAEALTVALETWPAPAVVRFPTASPPRGGR